MKSSKSILLFLVATAALLNTLALAPNSWQKRLDKALLDIDGARTPQARFRLLQRALQDPNLPKDISRGVESIREKGIGKGHPAFIDAVWPKGTIARQDIEGIQALVKSIPERVEEFRGTSSPDVSSLLGVIQNQDYREVLQKTLQESVSKNRDETSALIQNVFRRTPRSVALLPLIDNGNDLYLSSNNTNATVEIRQLPEGSFYVCDMETSEYTLANMGNALVKLSNSILKRNEYNVSAISSPFIMQGSNMYMWKKEGMDNVDEKVENDDEISLELLPARTLALLEFSGICTEGEIERKKNTLIQALTGNSTSWKILDNEDPLVLQYNAPGTLPWRRKNQIAFVVEKVGTTETDDMEIISDDILTSAANETIDTDEGEFLGSVSDQNTTSAASDDEIFPGDSSTSSE